MTRYIILHNANPNETFELEDILSVSSNWATYDIFSNLKNAEERTKLLNGTNSQARFVLVKRTFEKIEI